MRLPFISKLKYSKIYPENDVVSIEQIQHIIVNTFEAKDPCVTIYKKNKECGAYDQYNHQLLLSESLRMIKNQI